MLYTALEIIGWLIAAFVLGLLLMWLLTRGRSPVSPHEWDVAQRELKQAEADRTSFNKQQVQLTADLDARTRQVGELETAMRALEVQVEAQTTAPNAA
ncbi:MAG: hypothetical protein P8P20_11070, partial [Acidimicrobiales bacterium]|nr:hypothetical protein [Acidimicrobiales bacterium]